MGSSIVNLRFRERLRGFIEGHCYVQAQAMPLEWFERAEHYDRLHRVRQGMTNRLETMMAFFWQGLWHVVALVALLLYLAQFHWALPLLLAVGSTPGVLLQVRLLRVQYLVKRELAPHERRFAVYAGLLTGRRPPLRYGYSGWPAGCSIRLPCCGGGWTGNGGGWPRESSGSRLSTTG